MFDSASSAIQYMLEKDILYLDVRFCDLLGVQQHFTIPVRDLDEKELTSGFLFDGSSIVGFTRIHESDMLLLPDFSSAYEDPFRTDKTLNMVFSIVDPLTQQPFSRDPRQVAKKAESYLISTGAADSCFVGAEAEFHVFSSVSFQTSPQETFYRLDADSAPWNSRRDELENGGRNLGHHLAFKGGYFPVSPADRYTDLRSMISGLLQASGLQVERAHHEGGAAGQQEINYRFSTLTQAGDDLLKFKYIVKNGADRAGQSATFMPKPVFGDNGSGMHVHMSLWKNGQPLFYDPNGYAGLSDTARWFIGGLLEHGPALLAFTNPSLNSYRRLVPGFEAPINLVYSSRNRSACIRIPVTGSSPGAKRVEYRVPDPTANPYLAFAACLMAGLDGIRARTEPPLPIDKDLYDLPPEDYADIEKLPSSLESAIEALKADHDFLLAGDVFTQDLIDTWIELKETREISPARVYPHPMEFELYYGI